MLRDSANDTVDVPGYRIERCIGRGGMAAVFLATQLDLGRTVALKVLAPERTPDAEAVARFEQEARTIAQLNHPHIVSIHEVGSTSDGRLYYSMPFLTRGDLASRSRYAHTGHIMTVMRALLGALAYAHEQGIIHRDVKPANVLFDDHDQPQLADFGIALNTREDLRVTRAGATVGSSGYMSPEQARGLHADGRSDLYSAGVMLYELLTGDMPYDGPDALSVALAHAEDPIPPLPERLDAWQDVIDGALAKNPDDRFDSAADMLAALETAARRADDEEQGGYRVRRWWRNFRYRYQHGVVLGSVTLLAIIAVIATLVLLRHDARMTPARQVRASAPIAPPAITPPPMLSTDQLDRLLANGNAQLHAGALVEPTSHNAAEDFLRILQTYPDNPEALSGIQAVLDALAVRVDHALGSGDVEQTMQLYQQAQDLANHGDIREQAFWPAFVDHVDAAVAYTLKHAARKTPQQLAALQQLATAFHQPLPADAPRERASTPALHVGSRLHDDGGPALVVVSMRAGHAYAIGTHEITRAQYARFVHASRRAPSVCRKLGNIFSVVHQWTWRDPGFKQADDAPAVCISWHDARAYLGWLSQSSGERYRLPTRSEWEAARRLRGDTAPRYPAHIQDWLLCAGRCDSVNYRGNIDHGSSKPDAAYTSVGLRVVREIDRDARLNK